MAIAGSGSGATFLRYQRYSGSGDTFSKVALTTLHFKTYKHTNAYTQAPTHKNTDTRRWKTTLDTFFSSNVKFPWLVLTGVLLT
jgi:hypothetical protein